ncbi:MAG: TetR/AcrR family transcriptional regulator [Acidimicrobiia bacterium]
MVEAACRLLSTEGPEALTTRRIAAEAGTTTMTLYARFGDKDGVEQAVVVEGFTRLKAALERAAERSKDPVQGVVAVARAYRRFAQENPAFYAAMFQRAGRAVMPTAESHRLGTETFSVVAGVVQRAIDAGNIDDDATVVARRVWAMCHGVVSLELVGMGVAREAADSFFDGSIRSVLDGHTGR